MSIDPRNVDELLSRFVTDLGAIVFTATVVIGDKQAHASHPHVERCLRQGGLSSTGGLA